MCLFLKDTEGVRLIMTPYTGLMSAPCGGLVSGSYGALIKIDNVAEINWNATV